MASSCVLTSGWELGVAAVRCSRDVVMAVYSLVYKLHQPTGINKVRLWQIIANKILKTSKKLRKVESYTQAHFSIQNINILEHPCWHCTSNKYASSCITQIFLGVSK